MVIGRKERVGEALEVKTFGDLRTKLGSDIIIFENEFSAVNRHNYQNVNGKKNPKIQPTLQSHAEITKRSLPEVQF